MEQPRGFGPDVNLNLNVRGLRQSATVAINERCNELRRAGREIFKLGLGQSPFPVPRPVVKELELNAFQKDYLPVSGLPELRAAVADYHRRSQGANVSAEDVLIGPGSKELMFLLQLAYYGDIVIPSPSWVSYAPQAQIIGRPIKWIETRFEDGWRLGHEALRSLCADDIGRPRVLILNYPNNPTGRTYPQRELEALAEEARRARIIVLSDEIYGELDFGGRHVSIARFYPEGTILSSGLSKWCGAGGWRLGTFAFPRSLSWLRESMAAIASETFTSTSAPIQYAAVRAFAGGEEIESYLVHSRRILAALGDWIWRNLETAGAEILPAEGGFYLFPRFSRHSRSLAARGITTSAMFCARLLEETGVAILPGSDFGRPPTELSARLAFVDFDGARCLAQSKLQTAGEAIDETFLHAYAPNVLRAIERLVEWLGPADK